MDYLEKNLKKKMSAGDFNHWMQEMKKTNSDFTQIEAAKALNVSRRSIQKYTNNGAPVAIALACNAIINGLEPYTEKETK